MLPLCANKITGSISFELKERGIKAIKRLALIEGMPWNENEIQSKMIEDLQSFSFILWTYVANKHLCPLTAASCKPLAKISVKMKNKRKTTSRFERTNLMREGKKYKYYFLIICISKERRRTGGCRALRYCFGITGGSWFCPAIFSWLTMYRGRA